MNAITPAYRAVATLNVPSRGEKCSRLSAGKQKIPHTRQMYPVTRRYQSIRKVKIAVGIMGKCTAVILAAEPTFWPIKMVPNFTCEQQFTLHFLSPRFVVPSRRRNNDRWNNKESYIRMQKLSVLFSCQGKPKKFQLNDMPRMWIACRPLSRSHVRDVRVEHMTARSSVVRSPN